MHLPRRFDDALMSAPDGHAAVDAALLSLLRAWCEGGAFPTMTEPLQVASIAPHAGLDGVACALDGSHELAHLGRWRGLLWRLQILWRECVVERGVRPGDPWDCGWWQEVTMAPAAAFRPRRATLLMVRDTDPAVAAALISALRVNGSAYAKPVRVLLVSAGAVDGIARL